MWRNLWWWLLKVDGGKGEGSKSRFTKNKFVLSQFTENKIGTSRFTKKMTFVLTRTYVTYDIWKVTPRGPPLQMCLLAVRFLFCSAKRIPSKSKGYWVVPFNLKVLAKFGLCSNCSQKLDKSSLACARETFATVCSDSRSNSLPCSGCIISTLGAKNWCWKQCFPYGKIAKLWENMHSVWSMFLEKTLPCFVNVLLKHTSQSSVPCSRENPTWNILLVNAGIACEQAH